MAKGDTCAGCGEPATKRCARCKEVWYCGSECHRKHWKEQKSECRTAKATAKKKLKEAKRRGALEPEGPEGAALLPPPPPGTVPPPPPGTVLHSYAAFRGLWGDAGGGGGGAGGKGADTCGDKGEGEGAVPEVSSSTSTPGEGAAEVGGSCCSSSGGAGGVEGGGGSEGCEEDDEIVPTALRAVPVGLHNVGNTCFANSVLQCLAQAGPAVRALRTHDRGTCTCPGKWCVLCEMGEFFENYEAAAGGKCVSPRNLLAKIKKMGRHLTFGAQEDSHDFLLQLLDSMQMRVLADYGGEKRVPHAVRETTNVWHAFGGRTRGQVECRQCGHVSSTVQGCLTLELQIPSGVDSLEAALEAFTEEETLIGDNAYRCDQCKERVEAARSTRLEVGPNFLQIALKRFSLSPFSRLGGGKISRAVSFGAALDLVPFMSADSLDQPPPYLLYGIIVHISPFSAGGHYVAYVKAGDDNWYECDDSSVTEVDEDEVLSQTAYMFFYRRVSPRSWSDCQRSAEPMGEELGASVSAPAPEAAQPRLNGAPENGAPESGAPEKAGCEPRELLVNGDEGPAASAAGPGLGCEDTLSEAPASETRAEDENGAGGGGEGESGGARVQEPPSGERDVQAPKYSLALKEGPTAATNTLCVSVELPGVKGAQEVSVKLGGGSVPIQILADGYLLELGPPFSAFRHTKTVFVRTKEKLRLEFAVPPTYRPPPAEPAPPAASCKKTNKKKNKGKK